MESENLQIGVRRIPTDLIRFNPENPRIIPNPKQMQTLLESIEERGIIVPLIVYPDDGKFTLLDGERRLRCARRLNLPDVPANIIAKPTKLGNILQMFHIHKVRYAWELIEVALSLKVVLQDETFKEKTTEEIARLTGLTKTTISRCKRLLDLNPKYQQMIIETYKNREEGIEPLDETKLTEDFFFEAQRAISSIRRFHGDLFEEYGGDGLLEKFVEKRRSGVFSNVIELGRTIPKIISAGRKGVSPEKVSETIRRLVEDPEFKIDKAYQAVAAATIASLDIEKRCLALTEELHRLRAQYQKKELKSRLDELLKALKELRQSIDETLVELA